MLQKITSFFKAIGIMLTAIMYSVFAIVATMLGMVAAAGVYMVLLEIFEGIPMVTQ